MAPMLMHSEVGYVITLRDLVSGPDAEQRVVVYSAEEQLHHLGQANTRYIKRTFIIAPLCS